MLKIKGVDIFSWNTIKTGVKVHFLALFLSIPLLIPPGFVLFLNLHGWIVRKHYGEEHIKFLSRESMLVGWMTIWRYFAFFVTLFLFLMLLLGALIPVNEAVGVSDEIWLLPFMVATLFIALIATGWSVERVGFMQHHPDEYAQERASVLQIKSILKQSGAFLTRNWSVLLPALLLTSGVTEAIVHLYGNPLSSIPHTLKEHIVSQLGLIISMSGDSVLLAMVLQIALHEGRTEAKILGLFDTIKQLIPIIRRVLLIAVISAIIINLGIYLIIPGLIALIWFFFVVQVAVAENGRTVAAIFHRSKALSRGRVGQIIAVEMVIFAPYLAMLIIDAVADGKILSAGKDFSVINYTISVAMSLFWAIMATFAYLDLIALEKQVVDNLDEASAKI